MGISYGKKVLRFEGNVSIEDAEKLFEHMLSVNKVKVDMSGLTHIHTAVFQILLLFREKIEITKPPEDEKLKLIVEGGAP